MVDFKSCSALLQRRSRDWEGNDRRSPRDVDVLERDTGASPFRNDSRLEGDDYPRLMSEIIADRFRKEA